MEWEAVIGLEVHIQLQTRSKIFSGSPTTYGAEPNTQASAIDLGLPGILPVLNQKVVEMAIKFGLGTNATINRRSVFARKNYYYPDLPKGYQISQHDLPIISDGILEITDENGQERRIRIRRAHLEEDAGKSLHEDFQGFSGIDLNRAGTPLLEIVSEPELYSAKDAVIYLKTLHSLIRCLEICDGNMQEGSFRCDANVSIRPKGSQELGTRTETKNLNSFRFLERAINYEIERQIAVRNSGGEIIQETRLFDSQRCETRSLRTKEDAQDYRYFPDPDLLPLVIEQNLIDRIQSDLPELPQQKRDRFQSEYHLSRYDAHILSSDKDWSDYFEKVLQISKVSPKLIANWLIVELASALNKENLSITQSKVNPEAFAILMQRIHDETLSGKTAKIVFEHLWQSEQGNVDSIIEREGLKQVTDTGAIERLIDEVIAQNPTQLAEFRSGKDKLFGFFVGQAMKLSQGKANPQQVNDLLMKKLKGDL